MPEHPKTKVVKPTAHFDVNVIDARLCPVKPADHSPAEPLQKRLAALMRAGQWQQN
jgi:hypothetical protein